MSAVFWFVIQALVWFLLILAIECYTRGWKWTTGQ
jgi:hypothetical protein